MAATLVRRFVSLTGTHQCYRQSARQLSNAAKPPLSVGSVKRFTKHLFVCTHEPPQNWDPKLVSFGEAHPFFQELVQCAGVKDGESAGISVVQLAVRLIASSAATDAPIKVTLFHGKHSRPMATHKYQEGDLLVFPERVIIPR